MGKIVSNFFISLDGVVEAPERWHFPYWSDEMGASIGKGMEATEAFLMGRVLYEEWADHWPTSTDEPVASIFNEMPKYVVSTTLRDPSWRNTTVIGGDVAAGIRELKARTEGDIAISGSATLVRWLVANELVDELHLLVHPVVVGRGQRLFEDTPTHPLQLVSHETFGSGVLDLVYAPATT